VTVRVRVPAQAVPGEELVYRISVVNCSRAAAHHVALRNPLPSNVRFVRANPEPTAMAPVLLWQLGTLPACARREIVLVVVPTGDGDVSSCARVVFEHGQCVRTRITRPGRAQLQLRKTGPEQALLYDPITFRLELTNTGEAPARAVKVTDTLPDGLEFLTSRPSARGDNPLTWDLGELAPGQTRRIEYQAAARRTGTFRNQAVAEAAGGLRQEAAATVRVGEASLVVIKTGPQRRLVGREALYRITVRNTGTMPATDLQLADDVPAEIEFLRASDEGRLEGKTVKWSLGRLEPGARRSVQLVVRARQAGTLRNVVTATAERGLAEQGKAQTRFVAAEGLAVEIDKSADPLDAGGRATLTLRLLNPGKAGETGVALTLTLPEGLKVLDSKGPSAARHEGQKVTFAPLATLAAGAEAAFTVQVQAERPGVLRLAAEATSDRIGRDKPVGVEETLTILPAGPER
jgi:uncharacterized repeat protein (TIGR01451 family)